MSLLHDLFQEYFHYNVEEINASDSKDYLIKFKPKWYVRAENEYKREESGTPPFNFILKSIFRNFPMHRSFSEIPFRVLIIQDADSLSMDIQEALRRTMEKSSRTCRFCLICENLAKIIDPIRSRCVVFHFTPLREAEIAAILRYIISQENISVDNEALLALTYLGRGNLIRTINFLQTVAVIHSGKPITADSVYEVANHFVAFKLKEMIEFALNKEFSPARTKLRELFLQHGLTGKQITEQIRSLSTKLPIPMEWKVQILELLGDYEIKMRKGDNEEIQLSAFIAQLGVLKLS